jgi:hypothetical protein
MFSSRHFLPRKTRPIDAGRTPQRRLNSKRFEFANKPLRQASSQELSRKGRMKALLLHCSVVLRCNEADFCG